MAYILYFLNVSRTDLLYQFSCMATEQRHIYKAQTIINEIKVTNIYNVFVASFNVNLNSQPRFDVHQLNSPYDDHEIKDTMTHTLYTYVANHSLKLNFYQKNYVYPSYLPDMRQQEQENSVCS